MKAKMDTYEGLGKPDDKKEQKVMPFDLTDVLAAFEQCLDWCDFGLRIDQKVKGIGFSLAHELVKRALTPGEIDQLVQNLGVYQHRPSFQYIVSNFCTQLIQDSFRGGNNQFSIYAGSLDYALKNFMDPLEGNSQENICVTVNGDLSGAASALWYADITVHGSIGNGGVYVRDSKLTVYGSCPEMGDHGIDSTFRVTTQDMYDQLLKTLVEGNTAVLFDPETGEEIQKVILQ